MQVKVIINFNDPSGSVVAPQIVGLPEQINIQENTESYTIAFTDGSRGYKGFQLDVSTLNGDSRFYEPTGYPGIITRALSDASGVFEPVIQIPIDLQIAIPEILWIGFDKACKEYATTFSIANITRVKRVIIEDNKASVIGIPMSLIDARIGDDIVLKINRWSKANASAKVVRISPYYRATYTGTDLIDFVCSENLLDANLAIQPGICEQYADVRIYDRDNMIHASVGNDALSSDHEIAIYALDDATHNQYILGKYYISDWAVEGDSAEVGVTSRDISYIFDKINVPSVSIKERTVDDMLQFLFSYAQDISWSYIDDDTKEYCEKITTPDNWYRAGTLRELLNKICTLGMLRIYWHVNKFIVARCW